MPRRLRVNKAGFGYHVLNRSNARLTIFAQDSDYLAFENVLREACEREAMRFLANDLVPNHWHLVVWPRRDGDLTRFVGWLTMTHTQRWHAFHDIVGTGHLYQGRYKSFPIQADEHFLTVCRNVERNPRQAKLVQRAEKWRWSSFCQRRQNKADRTVVLYEWPVSRPRNWLELINRSSTDDEFEVLQQCIVRDRTFGNNHWLLRMVRRFGLESSIKSRGRPRKNDSADSKGSKIGSWHLFYRIYSEEKEREKN